jgi:DNA-binding CsgD family transcriptional regulator
MPGSSAGSATTDTRFWEKVDKAGDCWVWTASVTHEGVGQYRVGRRMVQAHRWAWEHMAEMPRWKGPRTLARPPATRFATMVEVTATCWLWRGSTTSDGYGQFRDYDLARERRGKMLRAHRFAWTLEKGPIPRGSDIVAMCGTQTCVRVEHLAIIGREDRRTELTPRQLQILQRLVQLGPRYGSLKAIADEFGVAHQTVNNAMYNMRRRLGVETTRDAVDWLMGGPSR